MTQDEITQHCRLFMEAACDGHAPSEKAQIDLLAYAVLDPWPLVHSYRQTQREQGTSPLPTMSDKEMALGFKQAAGRILAARWPHQFGNGRN